MKEVHTLILKETKEKREPTSEKNLLETIVEGAKSGNLSQDAMDNFIADNCKNICFPAYENGAVPATWTLMLLALYPEWQEKVRTEVLVICRGQLPSSDMLHKMKTVSLIYPQVSLNIRITFQTWDDARFCH